MLTLIINIQTTTTEIYDRDKNVAFVLQTIVQSYNLCIVNVFITIKQ